MTQSHACAIYLLSIGTALLSPSRHAAAQAADVAPAPYCTELRQVTALAASKDRFASIVGKPREGNYLDTSLPLPGWKDCSLYGPRTYTCDSAELPSLAAAEAAQAATLVEFKACLGPGWSEAPDRSSPNYVVLHTAWQPVSITLSTDQTEAKQHVVRVIVFRRGN